MLRKLFGTKSLAAISVFMLFAPLASTSQGQIDARRVSYDEGRSIQSIQSIQSLVRLRERVAPDLDVLASELSVMLAQDANRNLFAERITKVSRRTVGLGQMLVALRVMDPVTSARAVESTTRTVRKIESSMAEFGAETARVDIKLPVDAHVKLLKEAKEVYVAIAPLADEKDVEKVIAYSNGRRLELAADKPPTVPTLVVIGAEPQSSDPGVPIPVVKEPGKEGKEARVDDYVGIPYIYIYNDHEGWWCGAPEIYVRVKRFRFSNFRLYNEKVNLPGVDGERVWYDLGDRNSTYKYVNTSDYAPVIRFEFWEDDDFWCGWDDDYLGSINIRWTNLPFGGYTEYVTGSVRFKIDRD